VVKLSSEFPNDNPSLHRGVRWVCLALLGEPSALAAPAMREEAPVEERVPVAGTSRVVPVGQQLEGRREDGEEAIVIEELPPLDDSASVEGAPAAALATPARGPSDPFSVLVATLEDVARGAGSPWVAAALPGLLLEGRLDHPMPGDAALALAEGRIARGAEVTRDFCDQTRAWRAVLDGTSDDFSACGGAMLDEWAADLLARLLAAPARAQGLRRELRMRGVAAFGLVAAA
jgi:hypothetical protein